MTEELDKELTSFVRQLLDEDGLVLSCYTILLVSSTG
jgi:hypothetical protein